MEEISYDVPLLTQNVQDCVQASASQILYYYGINKTIEAIIGAIMDHNDRN